MAMDVGGAKGGVKSDINVTPLVDVMLVLLIIMMLVAPLLQQGVDLVLPTAVNTVDKPDTGDPTVVFVDQNNKFYVNALEVARQDIPTRVAAVLEEGDRASLDVEVLVVDDASTDGTRERVRAWESRDARVHLLARDAERGLAGAVLAGARFASGEVLVVMDADLSHPASAVAPHVTVSVGVAMALPDGARPPERLVATADRAMYAAKSQGRNRVCAERVDP